MADEIDKFLDEDVSDIDSFLDADEGDQSIDSFLDSDDSPLKTAAKEGFKTAIEDVGFATTGGVFQRPEKDEQGRITLPPTLVRGARVTGLPRTLVRSAGVGVSNVITGGFNKEALERAGEALSPEFVPREGEGIASFVADVTDPRFLVFSGISGAARAGLKGKAALSAATKEGAAIGGGFSAINAAERGYIEPQDALEITLGTVIGGGFGLIFQAGISSLIGARASKVQKAIGKEIRGVPEPQPKIVKPGQLEAQPVIVRPDGTKQPVKDIKQFMREIRDPKTEWEMAIPDFDAIAGKVPEGTVISPAMADVMSAARRSASTGEASLIKISKPRGQSEIGVKLTREPQNLKPKTTLEKRIQQDTVRSEAVRSRGIPPETIESSPLLNGTDEVFALKPNVIAGSSSWLGSVRDNLLRSTQEVLRRMGKSGGALATKLQLYKDVPQVRFGEFAVPFDRFLRQIPKRDWKQAGRALADVLEGKTPKYKKLDPRFVSYIQRNLQKAADEAKGLGLKILRSDGKEVPFAERVNYFPRVIKREIIDKLLADDNSTINEIAAKMVKDGVEKDQRIAAIKVQAFINRMRKRRYGHLERAREIDLPEKFYDRDGFSVIPDYFNHALTRFEEVRQFGPRDELVNGLSGKALSLLEQIRAEGGDSGLARQIFERVVGSDTRNEFAKKLSDQIRAVTTGALIQFPTTLLQVGQFVTPINRATASSPFVVDSMIGSYLRAGKAFFRAFGQLGKDESKRSGQIFDGAVSQYMADVFAFSAGGAGKFAQFATTANAFSPLDKFLRIYSSLIGKDWLKRVVLPRLSQNPRSRFAIQELESLGINAKVVSRNKGLTEFQLNVAAKRFADNTQGAPSILTLPLWWTTPEGKVFTQFKSFTFVVGRENFTNMRTAVKTGNVSKLINSLTLYPAVGALIGQGRESFFGIKPFETGLGPEADFILNAYANATGLTLVWDLGFAAFKGSSAISRFFQPPVIGLGASVGGAVGQALQGNFEGAARLGVPVIPVVGRTVSSLLRS